MPQQLNIESTMRAIQPQGSFCNCLLQEMGAAKKKGEAERGGNKNNKQSFHWCPEKTGSASSTLVLVMMPGELDY